MYLRESENREDKMTLANVFSQIQRRHPQHRVLLIADQFEELYTLCPAPQLRHRFLDTLLAGFQSHSGNSNVLVTTLRADFLGNALSYPKLGEVLRNADVKIRSMNREELSQVIVKPAQKLKVTFQDGLVEDILDDVEDEPGNLPLLEFALTELWQRRQGKQLTHAAYKEIGGVQGALGRHAEQSYHKLNLTEQEQIRRIFVQLVRPGEGTEDTRRQAKKDELGEGKWSLVQLLADERLVVTSCNAAEQETVEVVHEALIRNWGRLRQWMEKDRLFRAWQERLRAAMRQWEETKRDKGALLRGLSLVEAEEKLKKRREEISPLEQHFIHQSIKMRVRERLKGITGVSVAALAIITTLGGTTWYQSKQAKLNSEKTYYYSLGLNQVENNDYQAALESFNQVVQLDPNDPQAYYGRGLVRRDLGDKKGTLDDYNQALLLDPKYAYAYNGRGNARRDLGDEKGGLDDYNQALLLDPKNAYAYNNRGIVRLELGDKKGGLDDFNQALLLDPKDAKVYIGRGVARLELGDKKGGLDDFNQALLLDPKNAYAYNNRGIARLELGDKKGGLDDFNQALLLDPKSAYAYNDRGIARLEMGDKKGGLNDFNQALLLDPKYRRNTPSPVQPQPISHFYQPISQSPRITLPPLSPEAQSILCQQFPLNSRCGSKH